MKIICPNCQEPNLANKKECSACKTELQLDFSSQFQKENGERLTILDLFGKMQQLETRLAYVEENYSPQTAKEKIPEKIEKQKEPAVIVSPDPKEEEKEELAPQDKVFKMPAQLPNKIVLLESLLSEVETARKEALRSADFALNAELEFESKRIVRKIARLKEQGEPEVFEKKEVKKVEEKQPDVQRNEQPKVQKREYPKDLEALNQMLEACLADKSIAQNGGLLNEVLVLEAEIKTIKRHIKNQELAELYGKAEKEKEEQEQKEKQGQAKKVNKRLIFEIEQELSSVWKAKQKATMKQDIVKINYFLEKEERLKEELRLAENGEIQARLSEDQIVVPKKETQKESTEKQKVQETNISVGKTTHEKRAAVKAVKIEPQGPTAIEQFFAPIGHAFEFVEARYKQYKEEGKLPMFFLTIAGIITLLSGFGFLAQYSAVTYFGEYLTQLKVGFGFVCSGALIFIGAKLMGKDAKYREFAGALMGLGLSLNYLFIYFLSADPPLISPTVGFVLIFINTAVSIAMSLRYQSKIIAVLALFGGALAPTYLNSTGENTHIYFAYLWVLTAASAFVAHRLKWEVLNFISFVLVTLILGSSAYFNYTDVRTLSDQTYLLLFHAFAYLFAYLSLFDGFAPKAKQSPMTLVTLVGAQAAMIFSLFAVYAIQQAGAYNNLGIAYLLNMLPFVAVLGIFWKKWTDNQKALLIGIASAFVAAAIPAFFGIAYRGMLWASQGIVLLGAGLVFRLLLVRRIAYSIILGGLFNMIVTMDWDSMPDHIAGVLFTDGYINLWSIGVVFMVVSALFKRYEDRLENHEQKVPLIFNEVISVWGVLVFYITTYFFFQNYAFNLALIPMVVLLLWNNYQKLYIAEFLGLGQIFLLFLVIMISMSEANSYHFADQRLYGKIGMLEVMALLWGISEFYKRVFPDAPKYKQEIANKAREVFYLLLPLAILDTFNHGLPGYLLYGLWAMAVLTFALAEFTKSKVVLVEFLMFVVLAAAACFIEINYGAILLGNAIIIGLTFYKKGWTEAAFEKVDYQIIFYMAPYFAIASVGLIYFKASQEDFLSAISIVAALVITLVNLGHKIEPVKRTLLVAYRAAWGLAVVMLVLVCLNLLAKEYIPNSIWAGFGALLVTLIWSHKMIYMADIPYKGDKSTVLWKSESTFLHLFNFAAYFTFLFWLFKDAGSLWLTVIMVVHGIVLVFNGLKEEYSHLTKVYIPLFIIAIGKLFLVDMEEASQVMKIIVFIVIGVICLVAAFMLIKYNDKNKKKLAPKDMSGVMEPAEKDLNND